MLPITEMDVLHAVQASLEKITPEALIRQGEKLPPRADDETEIGTIHNEHVQRLFMATTKEYAEAEILKLRAAASDSDEETASLHSEARGHYFLHRVIREMYNYQCESDMVHFAPIPEDCALSLRKGWTCVLEKKDPGMTIAGILGSLGR